MSIASKNNLFSIIKLASFISKEASITISCHYHDIIYLSFTIIAIPENNAIKTVQQSAKDKEGICRRADARQRYLTQDFTL